jgi:hypothetical protein
MLPNTLITVSEVNNLRVKTAFSTLKHFKTVPAVALVAAFLLSGCGTSRTMEHPFKHTRAPVPHGKKTGIKNNYPTSFTIYPFKNTSCHPEAAQCARRAVYQAFSLIGPCPSIEKTDIMAERIYTARDALRVAREQGVDALIIGEAVYQGHSWYILMAYDTVKIKISIYETKTGHLLWTGSNSETKMELGLISLFTPLKTLLEHSRCPGKITLLYYQAAMNMLNEIRPDVLAVNRPRQRR